MSVNLTTIFDRDDLNFRELDELLSRAHVSIDSWGARMVRIEGYEGEEPLTSFPELILKLGETFESSGDFGRSVASTESVQRGLMFPFLDRLLSAIARIGILYARSDALLAEQSAFTRAMNCLGETLTCSYRTSSFRADFILPIDQLFLELQHEVHEHHA